MKEEFEYIIYFKKQVNFSNFTLTYYRKETTQYKNIAKIVSKEVSD